jgi:hypothetical protein
MSVIANVDRAATKTTTMGVVAIGRDTIAVVSTRGMIASCGLITNGVGKGPATAKDAHCLRLGIINDDNDRCSGRHAPFNSWLSPKMQQSSCYPPPCNLVFSCRKRGGGLDSDSTGMQEEDGSCPPFHPLPPPFPSLPSPPLLSGH